MHDGNDSKGSNANDAAADGAIVMMILAMKASDTGNVQHFVVALMLMVKCVVE